MTKKLKGRLRFSSPSGGADFEPYVEIDLTDESSRVQFLEARISLADFTNAALRHREVEMEFEFRNPHLLGTKHEVKEEIVDFDHEYSVIAKDREGRDDVERSPLVNRALKPFEVEGWRGDPSDLLNGHRTVSRNPRKQRVLFRRHVDSAGKPVNP